MEVFVRVIGKLVVHREASFWGAVPLVRVDELAVWQCRDDGHAWTVIIDVVGDIVDHITPVDQVRRDLVTVNSISNEGKPSDGAYLHNLLPVRRIPLVRVVHHKLMIPCEEERLPYRRLT